MLGHHIESDFRRHFVKLEGQGIYEHIIALVHKKCLQDTRWLGINALFIIRGACAKISKESQPITKTCKFI